MNKVHGKCAARLLAVCALDVVVVWLDLNRPGHTWNGANSESLHRVMLAMFRENLIIGVARLTLPCGLWMINSWKRVVSSLIIPWVVAI